MACAGSDLHPRCAGVVASTPLALTSEKASAPQLAQSRLTKLIEMAEFTYVIGDIHGCHGLLLVLLQGIRDHAAGRPHRLVFLGDYIDRGSESCAVVNTVRRLQVQSPEKVTCLMGNHEEMLLIAAQDRDALPWWLENGGGTTLASFGVEDAADLPLEVLEWMDELPTFCEDARRYYVHAGVNPAFPLDDQTDEDRLWIREPFLDSELDFGKHIVHGHTPLLTTTPDERQHRTNLDTAAVFGGALTAGVFTDEQDHAVAYLQVGT
jgi:serine/threonine protein phosphatase 1